MRKILGGFVAGVLVANVLLAGAWLWGQKQSVDLRGWKADLAHDYLAAPAVKLSDGRVYSRAQLLDMLINQAVQAQAGASAAPAPTK